jgi:hypothetical protein
MSMKFRTKRYSPASIEAVEAEKETKKCVWIKGWTFDGGPGTGALKRHEKVGAYENYFDSWAQAHAYLVERAEDALTDARRSLQEAQGHLGNVKGMKPPKDAA